MSFSNSDLRIGPCTVKFDGVDLGGTEGGVKVKFDPKFTDLKIDQLGDTPIDSVVTSLSYTCEFTLAASANMDNWKIAMPYGKLNTSGGNKSFYLENKVGTQLAQFAAPLLLHPQAKADGDLSEDIYFYKAVVKSAVEVEYSATKQRGLKLTLNIIPDFTTSPARFCIMGDPAIGSVAASAAAAVAGGSNTGNGTVGSISAGSATVTETITITCIGTDGANHSAWKVEGGTSGAIGTVEMVGGAGGTGVFTSNVVNFTITDGSTDFVVGDLFTIAMTAANYT